MLIVSLLVVKCSLFWGKKKKKHHYDGYGADPCVPTQRCVLVDAQFFEEITEERRPHTRRIN